MVDRAKLSADIGFGGKSCVDCRLAQLSAHKLSPNFIIVGPKLLSQIETESWHIEHYLITINMTSISSHKIEVIRSLINMLINSKYISGMQ